MRYDHFSMLPINAFRKIGGRLATLEGGGGKGDSPDPAPAPTSQTVTNTSIPEYARPYVETMLGKTEALTDINQNPYQTYGGQRIANFSPLQQQAFQNVAGMQMAPQLGQATGLAGMSGLGSIGTANQMAGAGANYQNMATNPYATQAYMNPYLSASLAPQLQELGRQFDITGQQQKGQSTAMGAFGGNRAALMQSENMRNKNLAMANLIGQGYDKAFQNAQQAQQFGANLGLQGLQGALSGYGQAGAAAGTLGQLGQTQYGQQMGINTAQQQVGATQQAQAQQNLDQAYQDFLKQKNYPYQQLAFMSDMVRGLPLSQESKSVYSAPPSALSQLGGLGMAGLGAYGAAGGFKAAGGAIKESFKKGGKITYAVGGSIESLNADQLTQLLDNPNLSPMESEMIEKRLMLLARMEMNPQAGSILGQAAPQRAGIGAIATGDMIPEEFAAANGGIVAFADKGQVKQSASQLAAQEERGLAEDIRKLSNDLYNNPQFTKSEAAQKAIADEIKSSKDNAVWNLLKDIGVGTAKGTSQFALSNLGGGAEYAAEQQQKRALQEDANRKLMLQQEVEQEKNQFGRKTAMLNTLQTTHGQLINKQLAREGIAAQIAATQANKDIARQTQADNKLLTSQTAASKAFQTAVDQNLLSLRSKNANLDEPLTEDQMYVLAHNHAFRAIKDTPLIKYLPDLKPLGATETKPVESAPSAAASTKASNFNLNSLFGGGFGTKPAASAPQYAVNPKTKERIMSTDGGNTWKPY